MRVALIEPQVNPYPWQEFGGLTACLGKACGVLRHHNAAAQLYSTKNPYFLLYTHKKISHEDELPEDWDAI